MSATLPNVKDIADWLEAELYITNYRPIPLTEYYKIGNEIKDRYGQPVRNISDKFYRNAKDPHHLVPLVSETIAEGNSCLMFCPTKKWCEKSFQINRNPFT
eukprot:UN29216